MKRSIILKAIIASAIFSTGASAEDGARNFSGSLTAQGVAGPDDSCAPLPFRGMVDPSTTTGHSSLGDFTYSHNICLAGRSGPSEGVFTVNFGVDSFHGCLEGYAVPTDTPGVSMLLFRYTIVGGTGRFHNASGEFIGAGPSDARNRPSMINLYFGNWDKDAPPKRSRGCEQGGR